MFPKDGAFVADAEISVAGLFFDGTGVTNAKSASHHFLKRNFDQGDSPLDSTDGLPDHGHRPADITARISPQIKLPQTVRDQPMLFLDYDVGPDLETRDQVSGGLAGVFDSV